MNWMRLCTRRRGRAVDHKVTSFRPKVMPAARLSIALAGLVMLGTTGCAHQLEYPHATSLSPTTEQAFKELGYKHYE